MEQNQNSTPKVQKNLLKSYNGQRFGRLTILRDNGYSYFKCGYKKRMVITLCDCGKEKDIQLGDIKSGRTTSCGCVAKEVSSKRMTKHGMKHTRFYNIYIDMRKRCNNPNNKEYHNYGGRGIKSEFLSFDHFKETMFQDYFDTLTLERVDTNKNYSPSNCTWITMAEQSRNKRNTIRYNGVSLRTYCEQNNLDTKLVLNRVKRGWEADVAISTPRMSNKYY